MSKWNVLLRGRANFERTLVVHADTEENAAIIAEEMLMDSNKHDDEIDIDEVYADPFKETVFEITAKVKK